MFLRRSVSSAGLRTRRILAATFWAVGLGLAPVAAVAASDPIELLYSERPPFTYKDGSGRIVGITAEPTIRAFELAGLTYVLREASPARRQADIQANKARVCSMGFYATPERRNYALFTDAVSHDAAMVALASKDTPVGETKKVPTLLANPKIKVMIKSNISYGPFLESQFAGMRAKRVETNAEYPQLVRLIHANRAHVLFVPADEAAYYLQASGFADTEFVVLKFNDMPPGQSRHIMCSKQVGTETIAQLNKAIAQIKR